MAKNPSDDPSNNDALGDTIDLAQQPIMETAEFKALVELSDELFGDEGDDDELTITDKFEKLDIGDDENFTVLNLER
jgi:hypothetical protein